MKTIIYMAFLICSGTLLGQNFNQSYNVASGTNEIMIDVKYGDFDIVTGNTDKITISGDVSINLGQGNDAFSVKGSQNGNTFVITSELDEDNLGKTMIVKYKDGTKKIIQNENNDGGNWKDGHEDGDRKWVSYGFDVDVKLTITIPGNMKLKVKSVYGDIRAREMDRDINIEVTYGGVELIQSRFNQNQSVFVESTYGHVDITVPATIKADLDMKVSYGNIYSNHDIKPNYGKGNDSTPFGEHVVTKLNGGGPKLVIESGYSNIYLRKAS
jgi:hypothetical protein